jgi:SWI/SNF-related matrix-associated actin-dependent regulator of chromatin subfamily A member 5
MITYGAEKIINSSEEYNLLLSRFNPLLSCYWSRILINDDIDAIIQRGEERTIELNSKYEGLNLEDLSNFKSEASVQQWEGEDFRSGVSLFVA